MAALFSNPIHEQITDARLSCERLRFASLVTVLLAVTIAAVAAPLVGVRWSAVGSAGAAVSLAILLGASLRLRSPDRPIAIALFSELLALIMLGGLASAAVAMMALRGGAPMADGWLRAADSLFGLSAQNLVAWLAGFGLSLEPLHFIYQSSFPQLGASVLLLPFLGRRLEAWRLCFIYLTTLLSCALISFLVPALGSFVYAAPATIQALPPGAGTYAFEPVAQFQAPEIALLGLGNLSGVITFPSFHTIMALLVIQAWSWNRVLRLPVLGWNLVVIFTTLPMGGHYFVDLLAGALVWMGWTVVADNIASGRGSTRIRQPVMAA